MTNDNINDIINNAHDLAKDVGGMIGIESIASRLEQLVMDGKSLNSILKNLPLTGFAKFLSVPALGMQFRRYKSANMTKLVATWRDEANSHVYEISVQRDGDSTNCGWRATAANDGHVVFQLRTKNRTNCEHFALSAIKRYLKRGHRKTYRKITKAKKGK